MSYYLLYYDFNELIWKLMINKFLITKDMNNKIHGQFISSLWYNSLLDMYKNDHFIIIKLKEGHCFYEFKEIIDEINRTVTNPYTSFFKQIEIIDTYYYFTYNVLKKKHKFNQMVMNDIKSSKDTMICINNNDVTLSFNIKVINRYDFKEFDKSKQINNYDIRKIFTLYLSHPTFIYKN